MNKPRPSRALKLYESRDKCEWVIAQSQSDAWKQWENHVGDSRDDWRDDCWREMDPSEVLTIWTDDETGRVTMVDDPEGAPVTLTVREWIRREGRGWLCTTESP